MADQAALSKYSSSIFPVFAPESVIIRKWYIPDSSGPLAIGANTPIIMLCPPSLIAFCISFIFSAKA